MAKLINEEVEKILPNFRLGFIFCKIKFAKAIGVVGGQ